ncbi:Periplasmic chaperone of outer membrane proteins Skp @ Outer membrane protein H precursor [hydrothermal vent metagenome]|uniref:Periplasmic chaperone of outer membrane proteins Skp @ Outer membrane protein H n=1 Tax=hydrothermal vent metagenome TaxID=652676 RepID=A0A3B0ZJ75_9ZZZZ
MRKLFVGLLGVLASVAVTGSLQAAELKIGVVNAPKVLEQAPQAEAARVHLEQEFSPRDKAMQATQKELKNLEERLGRDGAIMSETERRKLERDIISRQRDLKREREEFTEDLNIRRNEAFEKLRQRVFEVIVNLAETEKYDLILSDGVVFASDNVDITEAVIQRLSTEFKAKSSSGK